MKGRMGDLSNSEKAKVIVELASMKNILEFDYVDAKGAKTHRIVEVYDLHPSFFYGYDLKKDAIRSFKFEQMSNIKVGPSFVPRKF